MLRTTSNATGAVTLLVGWLMLVTGIMTLLGWHDLINACMASLGLDPGRLANVTSANFIKAVVTIAFTLNSLLIMCCGAIVLLLTKSVKA